MWMKESRNNATFGHLPVPSIEVRVTTTSMPRVVTGGIVILTHTAAPGSPSTILAEALTSKEATEN